MELLLLLSTITVPIWSHPLYISCQLQTWAGPSGGNTAALGTDVFTSDSIMSAAPQTLVGLENAIPAQMCSGVRYDLNLDSIFSTKGLVHATNGVLASSNGEAAPLANGAACEGDNVMHYFNSGMPTNLAWTAPDVLGNVVFSVVTASGYGPVSRGTRTVTVIANDANNEACVPVSPEPGTESPVATAECDEYSSRLKLSGNFLLCWTRGADTTSVMLSHPQASGGWIGLGLGTEMIGAQVVIGSGAGTGVVTTHVLLNKQTPVFGPLNNNAMFTQRSYLDQSGETLVRFVATNAVLSNVDGDPDSTNMVWARGPLSGNDAQPYSYHSQRAHGKVNWVTGEATEAHLPGPLIVHAIFMGLGWGLILPGGVLMARYGKDRFPVESGNQRNWFDYHKWIQTGGLLIVTIAFLIALVEGGKTNKPVRRAHFVIGIFVSVMGILQPANAIFRPHKKKEPPQEPKRVYWEYLHKGNGFLCVILGFINVCIGISIAVKW